MVGLGRGNRWARSAGVLLASVMSVVFLALAATAAASAVRESPLALVLGGAGLAAALAAVAYALTAARLVADLRPGSAI